ncbi:MAG: hypothetical protein JNK30_08770 [Phenylobacterium sp.]|uniref:hypothetical protein n=1 Tax=Phenylobacterium sp. TaxID=1871053 RepID=UPI001A45DF62|nr:hypothetical protein [Phenylobacterium sp.]MBL8771460.1 hypothetical protein [Phenylobacterium sp.]
MIHRRQLLVPALAAALAGPAAAQPRYRPPRTRHGHPELDGTWTNGTYTEFERPRELKTLVVPPDEARAWEARLAPTGGVNVPNDPVGQAQSEFPEVGTGLMRVRGEIRSSVIVDPEDGQLPYSDEGMARLGIRKHYRRWSYDHVEQRPENERCLTAGNAGAPLIAEQDANLIQIVQTRDEIALVAERYHDVRIVRLGPDAPTAKPGWFGHSQGRWEGDTLVVVTRGFRPGVTRRTDDVFLSDAAVVVERFTRTGPAEIHYAFTVEDPALYSRPWRGEAVLTPAPGRIFEYACHEGNYALTSILAAARQGNQPSSTPPKPAP